LEERIAEQIHSYSWWDAARLAAVGVAEIGVEEEETSSAWAVVMLQSEVVGKTAYSSVVRDLVMLGVALEMLLMLAVMTAAARSAGRLQEVVGSSWPAAQSAVVDMTS
jgi:hypothetical protein